MPDPINADVIEALRARNPILAAQMLSTPVTELSDDQLGLIMDTLYGPGADPVPDTQMRLRKDADLAYDAEQAARALGVAPPRAPDDTRYGPEGSRWGPDLPQLPPPPIRTGADLYFPPELPPASAPFVRAGGLPSLVPPGPDEPPVADLSPALFPPSRPDRRPPPGPYEPPPDGAQEIVPRPFPRPLDLMPPADPGDTDEVVHRIAAADPSRSAGDGPMGWLGRIAQGVRDSRSRTLDALGIEDSDEGSGALGDALITFGGNLMSSGDMGASVLAGLGAYNAAGQRVREERWDEHKQRMDQAGLDIDREQLELERERVAQARERLRQSYEEDGDGEGYYLIEQARNIARQLQARNPGLSEADAYQQALDMINEAQLANQGKRGSGGQPGSIFGDG